MEYLSNGPIDLSYFNEYYRKDLELIFSRAAKPSLIIWDYKAKLQVYSIYSPDALTKNKISNTTWDEIDSLIRTNERKSIIFFIESSNKMIDLAESIVEKQLVKEHHLVFIPNRMTCHGDYMANKGIDKHYTNINNFKCYGIPLENDVISLEMPDLILDMSDVNVLYELARTIVIIQSLYGNIPIISGKGEKVQELLTILNIMQNSIPDFNNQLKEIKIAQMLIFDRRVDMLTPLLSQITYESLLDELFHINSGFVPLPSFFLNDKAPRNEIQAYQLNSSDSFYAEIRDSPIYEALTQIIQFSQEVKAEREKYLKARKVDELVEVTRNLKAFLSRESNAQFHLTMGMSLNKYTKLSNHTDFIKYQSNFLSQEDLDKPHPYVEDCFLKKSEIEKVIQLICVQCICGGGLKPKLLNHYKKEIIRTYGLHYVGVLFRLEKLGLIFVQQTSGMMGLSETTFDTITRSLNLLPESDNLCNTYAGYVPVITRLAQYHEKPGWTSLSRGMNLLPGPERYLVNQGGSADLDGILSGAVRNQDKKRVVLIVFIGGVTRSEISTLRLLSQQEDFNTSFIILTTGILNLPNYLESLAKPYETNNPTNPF